MPMLPRSLVAAALAGALVVTSVPAEAQGLDRRIDPEAAAAVLFGLATLAIIANQAQRNKDRDDRRKVDRNPPPVAHAPAPTPRHEAPHARQVTVPSDCARRVVLDGRQVTGFGAPCLRRAGVDIARLPGACARRVDLGNRAVTGWEARCLHRAGVRIR
ncbi:hypothetical protein DLJ49_05690 [Rhodovulum sp. 12E13]|uniref:hypothetical protein n=1 Tax=Rhodovulum sp. 12E13 TaxID=2203891 RepID=UPI000E1A02F5|nr:hypothetical protein [Rhodovulum sp. 12E13]RDC74155.1 hypothetical protein DLJ49_05690 [Rhodovulum sp. 12E13]